MELLVIQITDFIQAGLFIILLLIAYKLIKAFRSTPEFVARRIRKHGEKALAKVLSAEEVPAEPSGSSQIRLLLQVEPEIGRYFVTEVLADNRFRDLHSGSKVQVMYDPVNRENVILTGAI